MKSVALFAAVFLYDGRVAEEGRATYHQVHCFVSSQWKGSLKRKGNLPSSPLLCL